MKKIVLLLITMIFLGGCMSENLSPAEKQITLQDLKAKEAKYDQLLSVSYYRGGGMEFRSDSFELLREEGKLLARSVVQTGYLVRSAEYEADEALLEELNAMVKEYNLSVWDELEEEEFQALDAPSTIVRLTFCDEKGEYIGSTSIDYDRVFPEGGHEVMNDFVKKLVSAADENKILSFYVEEGEEPIYWGKDIENSDDEALMILSSYWQSDGIYAYLDSPKEMLLIGFGGIERREFDLLEIVHEPLKEKDCSWHMIYVNKEDENDRVFVTMDKEKLYLCDEAGNEVHLNY